MMISYGGSKDSLVRNSLPEECEPNQRKLLRGTLSMRRNITTGNVSMINDE